MKRILKIFSKEKAISDPELYKALTAISARAKLLELRWKEEYIGSNPDFKLPYMYYKEFRDGSSFLICWRIEAVKPEIRVFDGRRGIAMPKELAEIMGQLLNEL